MSRRLSARQSPRGGPGSEPASHSQRPGLGGHGGQAGADPRRAAARGRPAELSGAAGECASAARVEPDSWLRRGPAGLPPPGGTGVGAEYSPCPHLSTSPPTCPVPTRCNPQVSHPAPSFVNSSLCWTSERLHTPLPLSLQAYLLSSLLLTPLHPETFIAKLATFPKQAKLFPFLRSHPVNPPFAPVTFSP